jgi:hemoglobin
MVLGACATPAPPSPTPAAPKPLFDRLGGEPAVRAVVGAAFGNIAADGRINYLFAMSDLARVQEKLYEQICEVAGGPCHYSGRDMVSTHAHLAITDAQFDALVEDVVKALDQFHVPAAEKGELLAPLAALRDDIVTVRSAER